MAYDEYLVERIRPILARCPLAQSEKRMFGGYGFFVNGNMAVGVIENDIILKLGEEDAAAAVASHENAQIAVLGGNTIRSWVLVDQTDLDDEALAGWVNQALDYIATLPEKVRAKKK